MRKLLFLVLVMALVMPAVIGAGGRQAAAQRPAAAVDSPYALPFFDPPQDFTIFWRLNPKATATITDYAEMTLFQEYRRRFGMNFIFHHPPLDRETEVFNLMRASGDFTDFVYWENWTGIAGGLESAFREGLAIDITDIANPHNSPHFSAFLRENPHLRRHFVSDAGRMYGFPLLRYGMTTNAVWGFMLREDWLERVGWRADNIRTTQDLHTVLTLFKNSNLNPGGQVFPFTANGTGLQNALLMWGISGDFYQKDGRVYYGPITPEFREAVTTLAQWYREGLIHPDYATQDARAGNANMLNNVSGFYWGETGGISVMYMATWQDTNPNARVVGIRTPTATRDGRHWTHSNDIIYNGVALAISRTNRFPVESVRFMDWGYSREGHLLQNLGPEGITYNLVNGRPVFTPFVTGNPAGLAIDEAIARHGLGSMQGPYLMDSDVREQRMLHYQWQRDSVDRWNTMTCLQMYRVTLNPDESRRFGAIMGDVNTRRNEMFDRFVMGREPITRLEDFQNELRRMGIEEALAIQQTALNRWNAR